MSRSLKSSALRFMAWRVGKSVNWDCSARDLAEEVGVAPQTVRGWAKEGGWPVLKTGPEGRGTSGTSPNRHRLAVDTLVNGKSHWGYS